MTEITIRLSKEKAEHIQNELSDAACWMVGYMAGSGDNSRYDPLGLDGIREINIKLKDAINSANEEPVP